MRKANFKGVIFIDIDKTIDWSFTDLSCDRVPSKGEIVHFKFMTIKNKSTSYYGEVVCVIDVREKFGGKALDSNEKWVELTIQSAPVETQYIQVILKEVRLLPKISDALYGVAKHESQK